MLHKVVVPFPCYWNGITAVNLNVGDVRDFGSMADGLVGMGWIEPVADTAEKVVVAVDTASEREVAIDAEPVEVAVTEMAATPRRKRK